MYGIKRNPYLALSALLRLALPLLLLTALASLSFVAVGQAGLLLGLLVLAALLALLRPSWAGSARRRVQPR